MRFVSIKIFLNDLKGAMKLVPQLWFLCAFVGGLALASTVWGETGPLSIERIECVGNKKTSCQYLVEQTSLQEKEDINEEKIKDAELRLKVIGYFNDASIRLAKGSQAGKAIVIISVEENSSLTTNTSIGFANPWRPLFGVGDFAVTDRNFSGHGDSLQFRLRGELSDHRNWGWPWWDPKYTLAGSIAARAEYTRPNFLVSRLFLVTGLTTRYNAAYPYNTDYGSYSPHTFEGRGDIALGYKIFNYSYVLLQLFSGVDIERFGVFNSVYPLSGFQFQYGWDSQDDPNFPTQGSSFALGAGLSGDYKRQEDVVNIALGLKKHWEPFSGHVLTLTLGNTARPGDLTGYNQENALLGLRYTNQFKRHASSSAIHDAAFYIEPGLFSPTYTYSVSDRGLAHLVGAKAGATFQTSFGVVNLFFLASEMF